MTYALCLLAAALATGAPIRLPVDLDPGTMVLLDAERPPARVELEPDGLAVRSRWYRNAGRTVVLLALPRRSEHGSQIALRDVTGDVIPASLGATAPLVLLPQLQAVAGRLLVFEIPARATEQVILVEGELDGALAMMDGVRIAFAARGPERALATIVPGPAAMLFLYRAQPGTEVVVRGLSLHRALPLPDSEEWHAVSASRSLRYELPERPTAGLLRLSARGLGRAGALRILVDGVEVYRSLDSARAWQTLVIPIAAHAGLLELRLEAKGGPVAVREVALDRPLPEPGPVGVAAGSSGAIFSYRAASRFPLRLRFRATGLDTASDLVVRRNGEQIALIGVEGGLDFVDADIRLDTSLTAHGDLQWITIDRRTGRGGFELSAITIDELSPPALVAAVKAKLDGPEPSLSARGSLGTESLSEVVPVPPILPGREARPVGVTDLFFGVPIRSAVAGEAPTVPRAAWAAPIIEAAAPVTGPVASHASLTGVAGAPPQPGQPSDPATPLPLARITPELPVVARTRGRIELATTPPGAAVFVAGSGGFRGRFLGFTPLSIDEISAGPSVFRFALPGYLEAIIATRLPAAGKVAIERGLLPYRSRDLSRPIPLGSEPGRVVKDGYAVPAPIDLDQDGRMDLVVGSASGTLRWLRDLSEIGAPLFEEPRPVVTASAKPLAVDGYAAPATVDWDSDGRTDLLVGARSGHVRVYRRAPLAADVAFQDAGWLVADGALLDVGRDAKPMVVDWNNDSVPDLIVGSGHGILVLYLGTGAGALTQVGPLAIGDAPIDYELDVAPLDFSDWTGDGVSDLVVGDLYGNVWMHTGQPGRSGVTKLGARDRVTHRGNLDLVIGTYPAGFAFDLDGDGYRDLFLGNSAGELQWVRGGEKGDFDDLLPIYDNAPPTPGRIQP